MQRVSDEYKKGLKYATCDVDGIDPPRYVWGHQKISQYFAAWEIGSNDGSQDLKYSSLLLRDLDQLRRRKGRIKITSGNRSTPYNSDVGGDPNSFHPLGQATDLVSLDGVPAKELYDELEIIAGDGRNQIIYYPTDQFVHYGNGKYQRKEK